MERLKWSGSLAAQREHEQAISHLPKKQPKKKPRGKMTRDERRAAKQARRKAKRGRKRNIKLGLPPSPKPGSWGSYAQYLKTPWWKARRKLAKKHAKWRCQRCNQRGYLEVHHKHYRTLGCERQQDLESLCRPCHEAQHAACLEMDAHLDAIVGR